MNQRDATHPINGKATVPTDSGATVPTHAGALVLTGGTIITCDADDRVLAVLQAHHLAVAGEGGYGQRLRQRLLDDERVVARGRERAGHAVEQSLPVVIDARRLAVHQPRRARHHPAVDLAHALVAQADAEDRRHRPQAADDLVGDAAVVGRAGAGADDDVVGPQGGDLVHGDLIVARHPQLRPQLAQVLHQVVGE